MHYLNAGRAEKILLVQVCVALGCGGGAFLLNTVAGLSALVGGGTASIANALFSFWVFGGGRADGEPGRMAVLIYGAELLRLITITVLFAAAFKLVQPLNLWVVVGVFLLIHLLPSLLALRAGDGPESDKRKE